MLLRIVAALRAVLITGQVELLSSQPLSWPSFRLPRTLPPAAGDPDTVAVKARAA